MKRNLVFALVMAAAAASPGRAQTQRDAIDALARGDYQSAASVLNPAVESWPPPGALADFVIGALSESGKGLPVDPLKACVLYARTAVDHTTALSEAAQLLFDSLQVSLSRDDFELCVLLSYVGLGHRFQPVTFQLEPSHWITLDLRGATIHYEWKETRQNLDLTTNGVIFLPVKHTVLTSRSAPIERRHFIEYFSWVPGPRPATWMLLWRVFEVVRDRIDSIHTAELGTIDAERPAIGDALDLGALARVRLNEDGVAIWEVLQGPEKDSGAIESESERRQAAEEERARKAADDRVDWDIVRDTRRVPALSYSSSGGCGHIFVYGWSDDRTEAITLSADRDTLGLSTTTKTLDLGSIRSGLEISVHVYGQAMRSYPFCTDVHMEPAAPAEIWKAVSGTVSITLSPPGGQRQAPFTYRATIQILGAEFANAAGRRIKLSQPVTLTAVVGWVSG